MSSIFITGKKNDKSATISFRNQVTLINTTNDLHSTPHSRADQIQLSSH